MFNRWLNITIIVFNKCSQPPDGATCNVGICHHVTYVVQVPLAGFLYGIIGFFISPEFNMPCLCWELHQTIVLYMEVTVRWFPLWRNSSNNCRTETYIDETISDMPYIYRPVQFLVGSKRSIDLLSIKLNDLYLSTHVALLTFFRAAVLQNLF